jgi:hypothetical protein
LKKEIIMLEKIAKLDSLVLRGLAVALIGLIGKILALAGVDEMLFSAKASEIVDAVLTVITAAGVLYAAHARINKPNPPLSDAAVVKTQQMIDEGKLVEVPSTTREE